MNYIEVGKNSPMAPLIICCVRPSSPTPLPASTGFLFTSCGKLVSDALCDSAIHYLPDPCNCITLVNLCFSVRLFALDVSNFLVFQSLNNSVFMAIHAHIPMLSA